MRDCFISVGACLPGIPGHDLEPITATSEAGIETISFDRCLSLTPLSWRLHNTSQWGPMGLMAVCSTGSVLIRGKLLRGFCGPASDQREEKATNVTFVYQLVSTSLTTLVQLQLLSYPRCFELVFDVLTAVPQGCSSLWLRQLDFPH